MSRPGGITGIPANFGPQALGAFNRSLIFLAQEQQRKQFSVYQPNITSTFRENAAAFRPYIRASDEELTAEQKAAEMQLRTQSRLEEIQGRSDTDSLRRQFQRAGALVAGGGGDAGMKANQEYGLRIQLAKQINDIEQQRAGAVLNSVHTDEEGQQAILDSVKARYQLQAEGDQASLDRLLEFQKIQEQQLQKTAAFASGLVNAGLEGGRAPVRFMENYAHQVISTVAGNAGKMFLGPMESIFSLGKSGIMGSPGDPNMLGGLLKGTIFGMNPMDQAQMTMIGHLSNIEINTANMAQALTGRSAGGGGANPSVAAASGVASGLGDLTGVLSGISRGPNGGLTIGGRTFPSLASLIQRAWGSRTPHDTGVPDINFGDVAAMTGDTAYSDASGGLAADGLPLMSTQPLLPKLSLGSGGGPANAMSGAIWAGAYSAIGAFSRGSFSQPSASRMLGLSGTALSMIGGGIAGGSTSRELSQGGALNVISGYGAWGAPDANGVQTAQPLSSSQQIGGLISLAGTEIAGVSSAVSGFSKGGASGDLQGIAGIAAAIAPFTGPAAPFVMAGAAMLSLISTLFTNGPQQRQQNEQRQLLNNSYVKLSPRQYNFSADGAGGFALDAYGGAISGAPTTIYPLTPGLTDMTAEQLRAFAGNNPGMWSAGVSAAMTSGGDSQMGSLFSFITQYGGN